jgi:hypothetical protein
LVLQIFEDIATFRGELKSAARKVVRNQYKIFPPNGAKLTPEQYHQHVKNAVAELIKDGQFHMNGADNQVSCISISFGQAASSVQF